MRHTHLYIVLLGVRLFFTLQKSYLHPDELFQGPELIVRDLLKSTETTLTWEFDGAMAIRSVVPIYFFYGPLAWLYTSIKGGSVSSVGLYYAFRVQQLLWSVVMDALVYVVSGRQSAVLLFWASSFVSWVWFTHTFSNSHEAILVLSVLHLSKTRSNFGFMVMGGLAALGLFTRISFIAFMVPLLVDLFRQLRTTRAWQRSLVALFAFGVVAFGIVWLDSKYFTEGKDWVVTPWNNFQYNSKYENVAIHGIHARYTHLLNLGVHLGPGLAILVPIFRLQASISWLYAASAISGFLVLSLSPHQEARFLLPCIPLLIVSSPIVTKIMQGRIFYAWLAYNLLMAAFLGTAHQSGVVPASLFLADQNIITNVSWTKSYPAPQFLVGPSVVVQHIYGHFEKSKYGEYVVMPAVWGSQLQDYELYWQHRWHFALDDISEFGLQVISNRGMGIYKRKREVS